LKKAFIYIFLILAATACKKEVTDKIDQDKIYTIFDLSYDENTDLTTATAEFRFNNLNGTRLELSDPSTVTVNGDAMEWSEETGNYMKQYSGFTPSAEFNWVDLDGNSFTNTANIVDIAYPSTLPTYTYADSINYFMWQGAPLDSFESVVLEFDGPGETDRTVFPAVDTIGATTITIDSTRLSRLDSGLVTTILVKTYKPELEEGTSKGGQLTGKYQPSNRTFNLQ
jgi:hypothetical protein